MKDVQLKHLQDCIKKLKAVKKPLSHVIITDDTMTAGNTEHNAISVKVSIVDSTGDHVVPWAALETLLKMKGDYVTIEHGTIHVDKRKLSFQAQNHYEYVRDYGQYYDVDYHMMQPVLDSDDVRNAFSTLYAVSSSEQTPVLTGVNLFNGKACATDRHRVAWTPVQYYGNITVPVDVFKTAKKLATKTAHFTLFADSTHSVMTFDNVTIKQRLLDGTFPDITKVIPKELKNNAVVDVKTIVDELKTIIDLSDKVALLTIKTDKYQMHLSSKNDTTGITFSTTIDVYNTTGELSFNCNAKFLLEAIQEQALQTKVKIGQNGSMTPVLVDDNALFLPYRIAN